MSNKESMRRADFEAWVTSHYVQFGQVPNLTRSRRQHHNYEELEINAMWWGWQAGQTALLVRLGG